jgi:hypothetical protein
MNSLTVVQERSSVNRCGGSSRDKFTSLRLPTEDTVARVLPFCACKACDLSNIPVVSQLAPNKWNEDETQERVIQDFPGTFILFLD